MDLLILALPRRLLELKAMRSLEFSERPRHMYNLLDALTHSHRLPAPQPQQELPSACEVGNIP